MKTKIYLVENCFGNLNKVYIGKTKNNRYYDHKQTYGDNIIYTIIDEVDSLNRIDWGPLESYWIEQFRQWGFKVVNKNKKGGGGAEFYSQESKDKISKALKGKIRPISFGEKMKVSMLGKNVGKSHSEETKSKMRESKLGKPNLTKGSKRNPLSEEKKKNLRVPKKNKIKYSQPKSQVWKDSVKGKTKIHPESRNINISNSLTGYKQTKEHIFKRSSHLKGKSNIKNKKLKPHNFGDKISKILKGKPHPNTCKPINQYNLKGDLIQTFKSITEACDIVFNDRNKNPNLTKCCQEKIKSAYGFIWKYNLSQFL